MDCVFLNKKWATNFTVRERISTRSYEIMTVSFRPHHLPREFGQVTVILLYVPGPDNAQAAECVAECYNRAISRSMEQAVFVLGDFNITRVLSSLHQSVSSSTPLTAPWTCVTATFLRHSSPCVGLLSGDRTTMVFIWYPSTDRD